MTKKTIKQTQTIKHVKHELKDEITNATIEIGEIRQSEDGAFINALIRKPLVESIKEIDVIEDFLAEIRNNITGEQMS